jgi:excisionase family DNA binding protein
MQPLASGPGERPPILMTVKEVASALGVSTATVYKLCETGRLQHVRVSDHSIRVVQADLVAFVARNRGHDRNRR